jgi:hypothetical protein
MPWKRISWFAVNLLPYCEQTDENNKRQYLLLHLRRIRQCSTNDLVGMGSLRDLLGHCSSQHHAADEEEVTMVAECLGSLTCLQPATMLTKLGGAAG